MFQGREWIPELGVYDYRHRMYQPDLGLFLQMDPMGLQTEGAKLSAGQKALFSPGGVPPEAFSSSEMNLFRYCADDPVNKSDPMGLTILATGDAQFRQRVKDEVQELFDSHPELRSAIAELAFDPNRTVTIAHADSSDNPERADSAGTGHKANTTVGLAGKTHYYQKQDSRIYYNPDNWTDGKGRHRPPIVALTHELGHALDYSHGTWTLNYKAGTPIVEERGIWWENITRDRLHLGHRGWNNWGFNLKAEPDE
jgi:NleD-like pathogen effector protein (putative zinc metallopeptidase)